MRQALIIARKDLLIEWRARLLLVRVAPFALLVLVLFAVALDSEPLILRAAAGLVWLAILFSSLMLVQRSFDVETDDGAVDVLLTGTVEPAQVYLGKMLAAFVQLLALAITLVVGAVVLYGATVGADQLVLLVTATLCAAWGLSSVGTLYGAVVANMSGRDSLLALLALPVTAPLLIAASRATEAAFGSQTIDAASGWAWTALLVVFAVTFSAAGAAAFGTLMESDT
ncbi:MAG: heme exporter protein CcmB [Actinomycetota bacterium]